MAALLEIRDLHVQFPTDAQPVRAVDGLSLHVEPGETVGLVGESGSGKSVTSLAVLGLVPRPGQITAGEVLFEGRNLVQLDQRQLADLRGNRIAMVFQDPMTSLNPFLTIAEQLTEVTRRHLGYSRRQALDRAVELLARVGIPGAERRLYDYPHQFSGGMRQRVMIATALSCKPQLLIADEPTTALDVTIQSQILELLAELQRTEGMAVILITHDLGVVASSCRRVAVLYAGRLVEEAAVDDLFARPKHPYTLGLLESIPRLDAMQQRLTPISGQPPDLADLPPGCKFQPRCSRAIKHCTEEDPPWYPGVAGQRFRCYNAVPDGAAPAAATTASFSPEPTATESGSGASSASGTGPPSPLAPG